METNKEVNRDDDAIIRVNSILKPCPDHPKIIINENVSSAFVR